MSVRVRRARSTTGSVSFVFDLASPAFDMPAFFREVAEGLFALSRCRSLALRTKSKSVVPDPTGGVYCGGEHVMFSVGGVGFSWELTSDLKRTDGVRRRWGWRSVVGAPRSMTAQATKGNMLGLTRCCL